LPKVAIFDVDGTLLDSVCRRSARRGNVKQREVIAALCEGVSIRTAARLTGVNRGTVGSLALRVGLGCMELHDRIMVGVRTERLELDEAWSFVGKKQKERPAP